METTAVLGCYAHPSAEGNLQFVFFLLLSCHILPFDLTLKKKKKNWECGQFIAVLIFLMIPSDNDKV